MVRIKSKKGHQIVRDIDGRTIEIAAEGLCDLSTRSRMEIRLDIE